LLAQPLIMSAAGIGGPCRHAILRDHTIYWLVLFASNAVTGDLIVRSPATIAGDGGVRRRR